MYCKSYTRTTGYYKKCHTEARKLSTGKTKEIEIDLPEFEIFTTPNRKKRKTGTGGIQKQPNGRYRALHRKNKKN